MNWKLWPDLGFGIFDQCLTVYIDFSPLPSGAIRCVGPFGAENMARSMVEDAMRELTIELEENHLDPAHFVIWGGYANSPDFREHRVNILDTDCGYLPVVWLRSQLLGLDSPLAGREWELISDTAVHKSGLTFPDIAGSVVDSAMFHPSTAEISIAKLQQMWANSIGVQHDVAGLPVFRWTPNREVGRARLTSRG